MAKGQLAKKAIAQKILEVFEGSFLYNNDVNDLHSGNVLMKGGRFVICDYAGYGW